MRSTVKDMLKRVLLYACVVCVIGGHIYAISRNGEISMGFALIYILVVITLFILLTLEAELAFSDKGEKEDEN